MRFTSLLDYSSCIFPIFIVMQDTFSCKYAHYCNLKEVFPLHSVDYCFSAGVSFLQFNSFQHLCRRILPAIQFISTSLQEDSPCNSILFNIFAGVSFLQFNSFQHLCRKILPAIHMIIRICWIFSPATPSHSTFCWSNSPANHPASPSRQLTLIPMLNAKGYTNFLSSPLSNSTENLVGISSSS